MFKQIEKNNQFSQIEIKAKKLQETKEKLFALKGVYEDERQKNLAKALDAQKRLSSSEVIKEVLEETQRRAHEKSVGAYENMLTALLEDVLPGERSVVLNLHTERGAPALDVFIQKGEGQPLEDALMGTGGSVTNLLSTGLRLVALMRSGRRRFLVLDESDCWIKPALIDKYAAIIAEMSKELGVQILMVSHHDESLFEDHIPCRLKMERNGDEISVDWSEYGDIPVWSKEDEGIRSISLKNFQSHKNTFIPLSSGVTLLQGDNDIGKSSIINALRAIFDGSVNDSVIQHYQNKATVEVDFGDKLLIWTRNRKGNIKATYELINSNNGQVIHSNNGAKVPDWLVDEMGIGRVDDLDIQIGQQQDPIFLLNQPASKRAKALAVGQESGYIQSVIALDKEEVSLAKTTLKIADEAVENYRRKLLILEKLNQLHLTHDTFNKIKINSEKVIQLGFIIGKFKYLNHRLAQLKPLLNSPPPKPYKSKTNQIQNIASVLSKYHFLKDNNEVISKIYKFSSPSKPEIQNSSHLGELIYRLKSAEEKHKSLGLITKPSRLNAAFNKVKDIKIKSEHAFYILESYKFAQNKLTLLKRLTPFNAKEEYKKTYNLKEKLNKVENLIFKINKYQLFLNESKGDIKEIKENEDNIKSIINKSYTTCPLCGK